MRVAVRRSASRGFTLVELLVGATLSAAVMAAVFSTYIYLGRSMARLANQQTLETESRRTLGVFAQDVQSASGISGTPSATGLALVIPAGGSTTTATYAYDSLNGVLTRTLTGGPTLTLVRNITADTCVFRYFDAAATPYDSGTAPYTTVATYAGGIKQVSLQFSVQTGNAGNGTQTPPYPVASSRLLLRNRALLQ